MEYEGKYKEVAEQFRKHGLSEAQVKIFVDGVKAQDAFNEGRGINDPKAVEEFETYPKWVRDMWLTNVPCPICDIGSFKEGYTIRKYGSKLLIDGYCSVCGSIIYKECE